MTDIAAQAVDETTPASPTPSLSQAEIEALIERKAQEISDRRVSGLQSMYDRKIADLRRRVLPDEDDYEDPRVAELEQQLAEERRQRALEAARAKFQRAYPVYEKLISFDDAEQQLAFIEEIISPRAAAAPNPPTQEPEPAPTPPVDPNSPAQNISRRMYPSPDGGTSFMSDDEAQRFIDQAHAEWSRRG